MNSSIAQILKICLGAVISLVVSIIGNKIDADSKD